MVSIDGLIVESHGLAEVADVLVVTVSVACLSRLRPITLTRAPHHPPLAEVVLEVAVAYTAAGFLTICAHIPRSDRRAPQSSRT